MNGVVLAISMRTFLSLPSLFPLSLLHQNEDDQKNVIVPPDENLKKYGEMGKPVVLPESIKKEKKKQIDRGWLDNAFNQYISDLISVKRTLPDVRDPG